MKRILGAAIVAAALTFAGSMAIAPAVAAPAKAASQGLDVGSPAAQSTDISARRRHWRHRGYYGRHYYGRRYYRPYYAPRYYRPRPYYRPYGYGFGFRRW